MEQYIDSMTTFTASRWLALIEAVNLISDKAKDRNLRLRDINFKQTAIRKYVDGISDTIYKCIEKK